MNKSTGFLTAAFVGASFLFVVPSFAEEIKAPQASAMTEEEAKAVERGFDLAVCEIVTGLSLLMQEFSSQKERDAASDRVIQDCEKQEGYTNKEYDEQNQKLYKKYGSAEKVKEAFWNSEYALKASKPKP